MWVKKCVETIVTVCILMSALPIVPVLAAEEVVKVGYYTDYTDIIEDIESLNNKGYGYEVFRKIEEVSDLKFEFVPIERDMFEAVNSGVVDVGGLNIRSDERREEVLYSANPFSKTSVALMTDDMEIMF